MSTSILPTPRVESYLRSILVQYARDLRCAHPGKTIRNAVVVESGLSEFERLRLAVLVKSVKELPNWVPARVVRLVAGKNGRATWIPTKKLIRHGFDIFEQLNPEWDRFSIRWLRQAI